MLTTAPIIHAVRCCSSSHLLASLTYTFKLTLSPPSHSPCASVPRWDRSVSTATIISHGFAHERAEHMAVSADKEQEEWYSHLRFALWAENAPAKLCLSPFPSEKGPSAGPGGYNANCVDGGSLRAGPGSQSPEALHPHRLSQPKSSSKLSSVAVSIRLSQRSSFLPQPLHYTVSPKTFSKTDYYLLTQGKGKYSTTRWPAALRLPNPGVFLSGRCYLGWGRQA